MSAPAKQQDAAAESAEGEPKKGSKLKLILVVLVALLEIGRASCRERV